MTKPSVKIHLFGIRNWSLKQYLKCIFCDCESTHEWEEREVYTSPKCPHFERTWIRAIYSCRWCWKIKKDTRMTRYGTLKWYKEGIHHEKMSDVIKRLDPTGIYKGRI